ncbi:MAG: UDP-N-acetylglucosamine 2-epimerase [Candidatus Methanoperedenaceae archaeon GB50]|nr:MAG: UDP-N-acetylglucosamine 2-epimerase [Candidatus Methanoperedenaceae archaeon GB50]
MNIESNSCVNIENSINLLDPLSYLDFLNLMANAKFVLTDSGGIQEETTILNIPCLTLRENTERPVTLKEGTNTIVGSNPEKIISKSMDILNGKKKIGRIPKLWDGKAAERIINILIEKL